MPEYCVTVPIVGYACVIVEAKNEEDAKKAAMNGSITIDDIESWEAVEKIVEGNCFHGPINEIDVEEA